MTIHEIAKRHGCSAFGIAARFGIGYRIGTSLTEFNEYDYFCLHDCANFTVYDSPFDQAFVFAKGRCKPAMLAIPFGVFTSSTHKVIVPVDGGGHKCLRLPGFVNRFSDVERIPYAEPSDPEFTETHLIMTPDAEINPRRIRREFAGTVARYSFYSDDMGVSVSAWSDSNRTDRMSWMIREYDMGITVIKSRFITRRISTEFEYNTTAIAKLLFTEFGNVPDVGFERWIEHDAGEDYVRYSLTYKGIRFP